MPSSAPDEAASRRAGKEPVLEPESKPPREAASRRAGKEPAQEPESKPPREWVALVSAAVLNNAGGSLILHLDDPPHPSYLALQPRRSDEPLPAYILAAEDRSATILLQVVRGNRFALYLCDTSKRIYTSLRPESSDSDGLLLRANASIGLIADAHHPGHYVVAQLHHGPCFTGLLSFSTADIKGQRRWRITRLDLQQGGMRNPFSETGVLAHDGRLWWLALAYGVFYCDPCTPLSEAPKLRFVTLPGDCDLLGDDEAFDPRIRTLIDQRRCVRPSEGKLRFVEIRGLSYAKLVDDAPAANPTVRMWTLDDPEGQQPWTPEYEVAFAEIWDDKAYADENLPREVPHVALVDPTNHFVVYFFQGSKLFGFDMSEKKVVACKDCPIDRDHVPFRSSRPIIDAWVPPPPPPPPPKLLGDDDDDYSDDNPPSPLIEISLLNSGLGLPCWWDAFCGDCSSPICFTCCLDHVSCHHGADSGAPIRVYTTIHGLAIDAKDVKANDMGYNWKHIQRKKDGCSKYIVLKDPPVDAWNRSDCFQCGRRVKVKSYYCSPACQLAHKPHWQNSHIVEALLNADFSETSIRDRFCVSCRRAFASQHCTNHNQHIHEQAAAAAPAPPAPTVVPLVHHEGWMLLPESILEVTGHGLQRFQVEGQSMFALQQRDAVPKDQAGGNPCKNVGCLETVKPPAKACSLRCWINIELFAASLAL